MRYFIILSLALAFVLLAITEDFVYRAWDSALARQTEIQNGMTGARLQSLHTEQLLSRIARDAIGDPVLALGLKQFGIEIKVSRLQETEKVPNPSGGSIKASPAAKGNIPSNELNSRN